MRTQFVLLSLLSFSFSCTPAANSNYAPPPLTKVDGKSKKNNSDATYKGEGHAGSKPDAVETDEADEEIAIPEAVTGALLRCGTLSEATEKLPTTEIACLLGDKTGKRIDPSSLGVKAIFTADSVPSNVKVKQRLPSYVARKFDSIFEISAAKKSDIDAALKTMVYAVELRAILGDESLGSKASSFDTAKVEPKRADWVSYLYGDAPTYVDQVTSLVWALDNGTGYTLEEGRQHCENLIYADSSDWRLPSAVELRTAHLNGLGKAYADPGNMNIDSQRFGGYLSSTLEFPDQAPIIGQSQNWFVDLGKPSGSNLFLGPVENRRSVICVHE